MLGEDNTEISVGEFVEMLWEECSHRGGAALTELLRFGHFRGWLEDSDERHPETSLNRQTAARIVHQFMVIELRIQDIADISAAQSLRDLYTCRVCANHIAQVYSRGIMRAQEMDEVNASLSAAASPAHPVLFFNHLAPVTRTEAKEIIIQNLKCML